MSNSYQQQVNRDTIKLLRETLPTLPSFCKEYFRGIETQTSALTRLKYAYDLRLFFNYLCDEIHTYYGKTPNTLTLADMEELTATDIEKFIEYLTYYVKDDKNYENNLPGKERKLSAIRSMLKYFFKKEVLSSNVAALVDMPKKHEKPIIHLEPDEVANLLDTVDAGANLSKRQQAYHKLTKVRDVALLTLFLSTGIRVSECVGIDLADVNFSENSFRVTRKGGDQVILYFSEECKKALDQYYQERLKIEPLPGNENALFLSIQRKRMDVRSVENLVKKYARIAVPLKKITPHKLRSTFGTALYQESGDIYLVADVLGHSDVNTTRKHYADMSDERRRMAAKTVRLRDANEDNEDQEDY